MAGDRHVTVAGKRRAGTPILLNPITVLLVPLFAHPAAGGYQTSMRNSGNWLQHLWDRLLDAAYADEFSFQVLVSFIYPILLYWFAGLLFLLVDLTNRPEALTQYKIQDSTPITSADVRRVIGQVLVNQLVIGFMFFWTLYHLNVGRGFDSGRKMPTLTQASVDFFVFLVVEEILFYYFHRLLHHPIVYKHVHKIHHQWTSPIAITAVYCHPIEHVLSNLLPVTLGPLIMGSHTSVALLWFTVATLNSLNSHSGYHLPFMPSPEAHDFHHKTFNQNFGVMGVLDWLHGTDAQFRSSDAYERHVMLLSLVPLRRLDLHKGKLKKRAELTH